MAPKVNELGDLHAHLHAEGTVFPTLSYSAATPPVPLSQIITKVYKRQLFTTATSLHVSMCAVLMKISPETQ